MLGPDLILPDQHVANAAVAILFALFAAVVAFALGLPNQPPRRGPPR